MVSKHESDLRRRIYEFIVHFIGTEGKPPTNREIGQALGITSTGHINYHLRVLQQQGHITRIARQSRGIVLPKQSTGIPVIGTIAAGRPLDIFPDQGDLPMLEDPWIRGEQLFALVVRGRSMIEDAICDGDLVVVKPQLCCQDGDLVVATHLLSGTDGSATLKRFFAEQKQVRLQPANAEMEPLLVPKEKWDKEWSIQGKVIALLRTFGPSL